MGLMVLTNKTAIPMVSWTERSLKMKGRASARLREFIFTKLVERGESKV